MYLRPVAATLPTLAADGAVRAWRLVLDVVAHGDGRIDAGELALFVAAYQEGSQSAALRIAELDALPALLRLALTYALFQFGFFVPLHHLAPFAELDAGPAGGGPRFLSWLSIEVRRSVLRAI